jgi:2-oxoglutarate dehydrogenase E2 component (dihydrolipoamide succinyltransferase)
MQTIVGGLPAGQAARQGQSLPPGAPGGIVVPGGTHDNPLAMGGPPIPPVVSLPLTRVRQQSIQNLDLSRQTIVPVTILTEVDCTNLKTFHDRWKAQFEATAGIPLTYTPFFALAAVKGLKAFPLLNAMLTPQGYVIPREIHLGVATSIPGGVLIPTVWNAESKRLPELARDIFVQTQRAKAGQLPSRDLSGSTFLMTNTGRWGNYLFGTPVIKPPNVGALAFETIAKRPVVTADDQVVARPMMYLSLSADHRAVDGAEMAGFVGKVKQVLENLDFA